jgi:hypothetical protein
MVRAMDISARPSSLPCSECCQAWALRDGEECMGAEKSRLAACLERAAELATPPLGGTSNSEPGLISGLEPEPPVADDSDDVARAGIEHETDGECPIGFEPLADTQATSVRRVTPS